MADLPLASEPARLVWEEGERERFHGPPGRAISEDAEERLYERLLDDLDRGRPLPVADLARVSDAHLRELEGEMKSSHIDVKVLRHLLARLGEAYLATAVKVVRAAMPEHGLFEATLFDAMAPVRAAELVRLAAVLFAQRDLPIAEMLARPFVPTPADSWLLRFADLAAPVLANEGDRESRIALGWIAAFPGGLAAVPASHRDFGAVVAPLASLGNPWLSFLAARGQDATLLRLLEGDARAAGAFVAGRALGGPVREEARAWLFAHRTVVEPVLRQSDLPEATTACALLDGDEGAGDPARAQARGGKREAPAFFDPTKLPAPKLRDGTPLEGAAVQAFGELHFGTVGSTLPAVVEARAACDLDSLDAFAVGLLDLWKEAGEPPAEHLWVLDCAVKLGGDAAAREIAARIRSWARGAEAPRQAWDEDEHRVVLVSAGDRAWGFARAGCYALGASQSDLALTLLDDLAHNGSAGWLRKLAAEAMERSVIRRGKGKRTRAPLADDVVPDLGLEADGTLRLDLGKRVFKVTFDETLTPRLLDETGALQKSFPRTRKEDDAERMAGAKARFAGLGKDAAVLARQQMTQLERAMCTGRVWALDAFRARFVAHRLLGHLGRRLVWAYEDLSKTFRVAEDHTLAGEDDATLEPPSDARVVLVHPALLDHATRARWVSLFGDYRIIQPFPQLARECFVPSDDDMGAYHLARARGTATSRGRLFQLARRGWKARGQGGVVDGYVRELPSGAIAQIGIAPPLAVGGGDAPFVVTSVECTHSLGRLPAVEFSELARDAAYLAR